MFDVFQGPLAVQGTHRNSDWDFIHRGVNNELKRLRDYYHRTIFPVPTSHLVSQIIEMLNIPLMMSYREYIDRAVDGAGRVCLSMRIAHSVSQGIVRKGVFYNNQCDEILIAIDEKFDVEKAVANWRELEPIRVFNHPYSDFTMARCNGKYPVNKTGVAVIFINVPMLMLQYRRWVEEESVMESGSIHPIANFVGQYPITNMVNSHLDVVLWNRFVNLCRAEANDIVHGYQHPIPFINYSGRIDPYVKRTAFHLLDQKPTMGQLMKLFPLFTQANMLEHMQEPGIYMTRYVAWGMIVGWMPIVGFLMEFSNQYENIANGNYVNGIVREFNRYRQDNMFKRYMPEEVYGRVMGFQLEK